MAANILFIPSRKLKNLVVYCKRTTTLLTQRYKMTKNVIYLHIQSCCLTAVKVDLVIKPFKKPKHTVL